VPHLAHGTHCAVSRVYPKPYVVLCSFGAAILCCQPFALCTHQECNSARDWQVRPLSQDQNQHIQFVARTVGGLALRDPCSLGPLDHVVASLQQVSQKTIKSQHAHGDCRQDHYVCMKTSQLVMLDCCLHWHCCSVAWLSLCIAQIRQANTM